MERQLFDTWCVEPLEARMLLAGDVTAMVRSDNLWMLGDNSDNSVVIRATAQSDRFVIEGLNGTTINGQESVILDGIEDDFRIFLRQGNNELMLTAFGPDGEQAALVVPDQLRIHSGGGNDLIVLDKVQVLGRTIYHGGSGDDTVVTSETLLKGNARFQLGRGQDVLGLDDSNVQGQLRASMGADDDRFVMFDSQLQERVRLGMGAGDDILGFTGATIGNQTVIHGNAGFDEVLDNDTTFPGLRLRSIEEVRPANIVEVGAIINEFASVNRAFDLILEEGTAF